MSDALARLTRGFNLVQTHRPNSTEVTRELVDAWYRERAHLKFTERTEPILGDFQTPRHSGREA